MKGWIKKVNGDEIIYTTRKKVIGNTYHTKIIKRKNPKQTIVKILNENKVIDNVEFKTTTKAMRYAREMMEEIYRGE